MRGADILPLLERELTRSEPVCVYAYIYIYIYICVRQEAYLKPYVRGASVLSSAYSWELIDQNLGSGIGARSEMKCATVAHT